MNRFSSFLFGTTLSLGAACSRQDVVQPPVEVAVACPDSSGGVKFFPELADYQRKVADLVAEATVVRLSLRVEKDWLAEKIQSGEISVDIDNALWEVPKDGQRFQLKTEAERLEEEKTILLRKVSSLESSCREKFDICNRPYPDEGAQLYHKLRDGGNWFMTQEEGRGLLKQCNIGGDYDNDCLDFGIYPYVSLRDRDFGEIYLTHMEKTNACDTAVDDCLMDILMMPRGY